MSEKIELDRATHEKMIKNYEANLAYADRLKKQLDAARAVRYMNKDDELKGIAQKVRTGEIKTTDLVNMTPRDALRWKGEAAFYKWQRDRLSRHLSDRTGWTHKENIEKLCSREMYKERWA